MTETLSLLHLDSSASGPDDSVSRRLSAAFTRAWLRAHDGTHRYRDLAADPVAPLTPAYCALARRVERRGGAHPDEVTDLARDDAERAEWAATRPLVDELAAAGTVVLGVPMYNLAVPAALKAWIDRVTFPGVLPDLAGTRVVVVSARGGCYGPGSPRAAHDFQEPYLRRYFAGLGVRDPDLSFVHAEFTRAEDVPALAAFRHRTAESLAAAHAAVAALAG